MDMALVLLIIIIAAVLIWIWRRRQGPSGVIEARDSAIQVKPVNVILPDEDPDAEERPSRRRTGETQKLERKVVHGPFRPIDGRGAPSDVEMPR